MHFGGAYAELAPTQHSPTMEVWRGETQLGDGGLGESDRHLRSMAQTILDRPDSGLRAILDPNFPQDHFDVNLYGRFCDVEGARDGFVGTSAADASKDALLSVCQL